MPIGVSLILTDCMCFTYWMPAEMCLLSFPFTSKSTCPPPCLMQGFQSPGILVSEFALVGLWTAATLLA